VLFDLGTFSINKRATLNQAIVDLPSATGYKSAILTIIFSLSLSLSLF